ncbi:MAG TPA: S8 family serine peptidase [Steroidobacteraceae bacterium]|nr:S8 family serine peptidase [Steroidobacteraceae bacterium]
MHARASKKRRAILGIASLLWVLAAHAQVLPRVPLPGVQLPALPVEPVLRDATATLRDLPTRAVRSRQLLEQHRAELDRDPRGEVVVRAEVVAIDITPAALAKVRAAGFDVKRTQDLPDLGITVTVLQTPPGTSARRGLAKLRKLDPDTSYDYNHVYLDSGGVTGAAALAGTANAALSGADPEASGGGSLRVGLIDGGVDAAHESLRGIPLHRFGCDGRSVPGPHGTAVASLLAGAAVSFHGAAPRATLFVADVYCGSPTGGAVDAVAAAFGWMAREKVAVVNVSLVGPRNALLERVVKSLVDRGHLIVAAVGNDGPAAPPLFPAAYAGVVGVTAVDARHKALIEACRGEHLDLAAPGADIAAASSGTVDGYGAVRGTSFAAPIVTGLLAAHLPTPDPAGAARVLADLTAQAIDLGAKGRDDTYGAGLVGDSAIQAALPGRPDDKPNK